MTRFVRTQILVFHVRACLKYLFNAMSFRIMIPVCSSFRAPFYAMSFRNVYTSKQAWTRTPVLLTLIISADNE